MANVIFVWLSLVFLQLWYYSFIGTIFLFPPARDKYSDLEQHLYSANSCKDACLFQFQIAFDLGSLYFYQGEYRKAFEKFRTCKQLLTKVNSKVKNAISCVKNKH